MYKSNFKIKLLLAASFGSLLLPWNAQAMSLGRVIPNSGYGEKLDADIMLDDADSTFDGAQLQVKIASNEDFNQVGLRKEAYHSGLFFKPYKDSNGQWTIKVRSKEPIKQQFVSFLISADWPSGHNVREYLMILKGKTSNKNSQDELATGLKKSDDFKLAVTDDSNKIVRLNDNANGKSSLAEQYKDGSVLNLNESETDESISSTDINPKADVSEATAMNKTDATSSAKTPLNKLSFTTKGEQLIIKPAKNNTAAKNAIATKANKGIELDATTTPSQKADDADKMDSGAKNKAKAVTVFKSSKNSSFHTKNGDNLWNIAKNNIQNGVTINQMMVAIYNSNKKAFNKNNINNLKPNRVLQIPTVEEAKAIDLKVANNLESFAEKPITATTKDPLNKGTASNSAKDVVAAKVASKKVIAKKVDMASVEAKKSVVNEDLAKLKVDKSELVKPQETKASKDNASTNKHSLEIVTNDSKSNSSALLLEAERLIAKQKENQELKEKSIILQAQLNDMKKLLALKGGSSKQSEQDILKNTANTPLISNKVLSAKDKDPYGNFFTTKSAELLKIAADNNKKHNLMFWIWVILLAGGSSLGLVYYYWFRYYKIQPVAPDLMNTKRRHTDDDLAEYDDINEYTDDAFVVEEVKIKAKSKKEFNYQEELNANFDLVKAYIELGDSVNAKKILDVILSNGTKEQKAKANKLMKTLAVINE